MTKVRTNQLAQTGATTGQAVVWNGTEWLPATITDAAAVPKSLVDVKGDLLVGSADNTVVRLAAGANALALVTDSTTASGLKWAVPTDTTKIPFSIFDAKGDLIVGTGNDTYARVPAGSDGQVLRALASDPEGLVWDTLTADEIPFTPFGTLAATNVQAALEELSTEGGGGGGGGGGGHTIQNEGVSLTQRTNLNFVGAGVDATDDGVGTTTITIPGGSGTGFARTNVTYTTAALAVNASEVGLVTMGPGWRLYRISTSRAARVRLYTSTTKRDADASRERGTDPVGDSGVMLDFATVAGVLTWTLNPVVDGFVETGSDAAIAIQNLSASSGTVGVTLTYVRTE